MKGIYFMRIVAILLLYFIIVSLISSPSILATTSPTRGEKISSDMRILTSTDSIQTAIDQTSSGETIQLVVGTYSEIVTINKPIHLKGINPDQTIILVKSPENGFALKVSAEGVIISNLTIINQGRGLYTTGVAVCADHTIIQNCRVFSTPIGIAVWNSTTIISECQFSGCRDEGIALLGTITASCSNNTIVSCLFNDNCDGIELQYATHNMISLCTFTHNTHAGIDAIISNNSYNTIVQCVFENNQGFAVYFSGSSHNMITRCSFSEEITSIVHSLEDIMQDCQGNNIVVFNSSTPCIAQYSDLNKSTISSHQTLNKCCTIQNKSIIQERLFSKIAHSTFLCSILSRCKIFQMLYEHINQQR